MKFLVDLENFLRSRFPNYPAEGALALEPCPAGQEGDFTLNCFKIARFCGNPVAAAQAVSEYLANHEAVEKVSAVKAFVNLTLKAGVCEEIEEKMKELAQSRREKQPLEFPSAGSYFQRPEGYFAGKLIEDAGLKGMRIGDAAVSEKHAGFLINLGNATAEEMLQLEDMVRGEVASRFGVELKREVRLIPTSKEEE